MGGQAPHVSGYDCVKLALVEIKRNSPSWQEDGPTGSSSKSDVCQITTNPKQGRKEERCPSC